MSQSYSFKTAFSFFIDWLLFMDLIHLLINLFVTLDVVFLHFLAHLESTNYLCDCLELYMAAG